MIETDRLARDQNTKEIYQNIRESEGPLNGKNYNIVFPLAIALGFAESNFKMPIEKNPDYFLKPENFGKYLFPIIHSLAIYEQEDLEIFNFGRDKLYKSVEEYANSGIILLNQKYFSNELGIVDEWCNEIKEILSKENIIERIEKLDL